MGGFLLYDQETETIMNECYHSHNTHSFEFEDINMNSNIESRIIYILIEFLNSDITVENLKKRMASITSINQQALCEKMSVWKKYFF